jgi:hypothetical protein
LITGEGTGLSVTERDGSLTVTAPADRQARVKAAIEAARSERSRTIMIECRFLTIDADHHREIDAEVAPLVDRAAVDRAGPVLLSERQAALLVRDAQLGKAKQMVTPRVTLFQNQQAYVVVATQKAYVSGFQAGHDEKGAPKFQPVIDVVQPGTVLQVRATATPDGSVVSLDCHPRYSILRGMVDQPWKDGPADQKLIVNVPDLLTYKADQLLTLPAGQSALLRLQADKEGAAPAYVLLSARMLAADKTE